MKAILRKILGAIKPKHVGVGVYAGDPGTERHALCDRLTKLVTDLHGEVRAAEERADKLTAELATASKLVADMHAAAVGGICGPKRGVVEDVVDLYAAYLKQTLRAERAEAELEEHRLFTSGQIGIPQRLVTPDEVTASMRAVVKYVQALVNRVPIAVVVDVVRVEHFINSPRWTTVSAIQWRAEAEKEKARADVLQATLDTDSWTAEMQQALAAIPEQFVGNDLWVNGIKRLAASHAELTKRLSETNRTIMELSGTNALLKQQLVIGA